MENFLLTLVSVALAEIGDRSQLLCAVLAIRFRNDMAIIAGLIAATIFNSFISAKLGSIMNQYIAGDALILFSSIAYILAAIGMLAWRRPLDTLEKWSTGAFITSFLGLFILQIGDKSQFIIAVNAAQADHWLFAFFGGVIGILIATIPAVIFQERLAKILPLKMMRIIGGVAILFWGLVMALNALRLIG